MNKKELFYEFILIFSRLEYALKREGYIHNKNMASFKDFMTSVEFKESFNNFSNFKLITKPPKDILPIKDNTVEFEKEVDVDKRYEKKNVNSINEKLAEAIRTVRNNLFHGEKGNDLDPYETRDEDLIKESIEILKIVIKSEKIKKYFENEYERYLK